MIAITILLWMPFLLLIWVNKTAKRSWNMRAKEIWANRYIRNQKPRNKRLVLERFAYTEATAGNFEELRSFQKDNNFDSIHFFGTNQNGSSLCLKVTASKDRVLELSLQIVIPDGITLELYESISKLRVINDSFGWQIGDLRIALLEPLYRWRISYNGLLKKIQNDKENYVTHVRFSFICIANTEPFHWPDDWDSKLQADGIARIPWNNLNIRDLVEFSNFYGQDQWGSFVGELQLENGPTSPMYLRGIKQRRWGELSNIKFCKSFSFFGVTKYGTFYFLGENYLKNDLSTSIQFGHVREAYGEFHAIDSIDIHLSDILERDFGSRTIQFTAGGKDYKITVHLKKIYSMELGTEYSFWRNTSKSLQFDSTRGEGVAVIQKRWIKEEEFQQFLKSDIMEFQTKETVKKSELEIHSKMMSHIYVIPFSSILCHESFVGGKGSSLSLLTCMKNKNFSVPSGFCLTINALDKQLEANKELQKAIEDIKNVAAGQSSETLKAECEKVVTLLSDMEILPEIRDAVSTAIKELQENVENGVQRYAVRSSAVGEDSEETSAAGQNSTYLGIQGVDNVLKAIAKCWASLFTFHSVEYRRQHCQPINARMGVCVQIMVNAESAGVMFTRHPVTGDPREIMITTNFGLGESVVSAMVEPDTVIILRGENDALSLKSATIGNKRQKIFLHDENGTVTENLGDNEASTLSISDAMAIRLAKIGVELESLYESSRDIEWAIAKDKIYLLQARPITSLNNWSDFELKHELDTNVPSDYDLLTLANLGEVFPGAISPLTASTIVRMINVSGQSCMNKYSKNYYIGGVDIVSMTCMLNYYNTLLSRPSKDMSTSHQIIDIAICGHTVVTPEIYKIATVRNGATDAKMQLSFLIGSLKEIWYRQHYEQEAKRLCDEFDLKEDTFKTASDLYHNIDKRLWEFGQIGEFHHFTSRASLTTQLVALTLLMENAVEMTPDHYTDIAMVLGGGTDILSAKVPVLLHDIVCCIKEASRNLEILEIKAEDVGNWLEENCQKAASKLNDFLKLYGHRSIKEFELMVEPWALNPTDLYATIQDRPCKIVPALTFRCY